MDTKIDLDELERLAQSAYLPWHIYKECQLDDQHEEIHDARGFYVKNLNTDRGKYCLAACNAVPELVAENRALLERVRELEFREVDYIEERDALLCTKYALERQRELLARNIADVGWCLGCQIAACPNVGSHLDPLLVNREECKEMIIQWSEKAAKEAGE